MSANLARDPIEEAAAAVLAETAIDGDACGTGGSCDDCSFGCHDEPGATACGNDGGTASAEERMTVAASGIVMALLAGIVVATGGSWLHLALATLTVLGGLVLAGLGLTATLRGGRLGDRLVGAGTRLLPYVTALLLIGIVVRVVSFVARFV